MSTRERPIDRAIRIATRDRIDAGRQIRDARIAAAISLRQAGAAAGGSASQFARVERGQINNVTVEQVARHAAVVGLDARLRLYPGPDPLRDAGHAAVITRFRPRLAPTLRFRAEVPLPVEGDLRAFDGMIDGFIDDARLLPVEVETRLADAQAQVRRLSIKVRDAGFADLLLVVADTRRNRAALRAAEAQLLDSFPISARRALAALSAGRHPGGSAIVVL